MKILLLEDMPEFQKSIGDALRARGHSVMIASTILEGDVLVQGMVLANMNGQRSPVDAVFADHDMPWDNPDGYDEGDTAGLVRKLRMAMPDLPIVAISAVPSNNDHLLAVGASFACVKGELVACMDEVLARCTANASLQ